MVYKEECFQIVGMIFEVFNDVGYGHKENFYQKGVANIFRKNNIDFKEQVKARVLCKGEEVGYYVFDFLVLNKIVVELKQKNYFSKKDIEQLYSYLKASNLKLGILAYFTNQGIRFKRIVNLN